MRKMRSEKGKLFLVKEDGRKIAMFVASERRKLPTNQWFEEFEQWLLGEGSFPSPKEGQDG